MEVKEFLNAVFYTWVEWVGIMLTIIPFIEKIPRIRRWLNEKPLLDRYSPLLWVIGLTFVFYGFFVAWRDQYRRAEQMANAMELKPEILFINGGNLLTKGAFVNVVVRAINTGSVATTADDWRFTLIDPVTKRRIETVQKYMPPGDFKFRPRGEGDCLIFKEDSDAIYKKIAPIPAGDYVVGLAIFETDAISGNELSNQAYELGVRDARAKTYSITVTLKELNTQGRLYLGPWKHEPCSGP